MKNDGVGRRGRGGQERRREKLEGMGAGNITGYARKKEQEMTKCKQKTSAQFSSSYCRKTPVPHGGIASVIFPPLISSPCCPPLHPPARFFPKWIGICFCQFTHHSNICWILNMSITSYITALFCTCEEKKMLGIMCSY